MAAQPVVDTIKESDDGSVIARTLDRSRLWAVQTPQTFRVEVIRRALQTVLERGLLVNRTSTSVIRMLPPFIIATAHVDEAVAILESVLLQKETK